MKIRNVIEIYSLDVPATNIPTSLGSRDTFFSPTKKTHETLYFGSVKDLSTYQKQVCSELTANNLLAIEDPEGSNHCILLELLENQFIYNKSGRIIPDSPIHTHSAAYDMYFSKSLRKVIADNPCSVIEVTTREKDCKAPDGGVKKHLYYDCAAADDNNNTSFICSNGTLVYLIIKIGKAINLTNASELVSELHLQKEITDNEKHMQDLKSELDACEHKQHEYEEQLLMRRKVG